jgi:hypothetical protein
MNDVNTNTNTNPQRQEQYFNLIDSLLRCPNGQEPEVLDANLDLIDAGLIQTMMQVATHFAHEDNQEGAKFLIYIARQLAHQLGLYPTIGKKSTP